MPVFGIGTWMMGGRDTYDPANDDEADIRAIQSAIERGITHIDTAELYGGGHAEELVAEAIAPYDRSKFFLVSKVRGEHLCYDDVMRAIEGSLQRLRTDYLDLYLVHWPDPAVPLKETMRAMNALREQNVVRSIGVSNFAKERLYQAQGLSNYPIVTNQVHYNLRVREVEITGLLSYCQKHDVIVTAYRPVEKGLLAQLGISVVDELSEKYGKTPAQIALNWLISQPNVVTIAKSRNIAHLEENLGALDWTMTPDDVELLRREYPDQQPTSDVGLLE